MAIVLRIQSSPAHFPGDDSSAVRCRRRKVASRCLNPPSLGSIHWKSSYHSKGRRKWRHHINKIHHSRRTFKPLRARTTYILLYPFHSAPYTSRLRTILGYDTVAEAFHPQPHTHRHKNTKGGKQRKATPRNSFYFPSYNKYASRELPTHSHRGSAPQQQQQWQ